MKWHWRGFVSYNLRFFKLTQILGDTFHLTWIVFANVKRVSKGHKNLTRFASFALTFSFFLENLNFLFKKKSRNLYRIVKKTREKAARKSGSLGCLNCWHKKGQPWQGSKKFLVLASLTIVSAIRTTNCLSSGFFMSWQRLQKKAWANSHLNFLSLKISIFSNFTGFEGFKSFLTIW